MLEDILHGFYILFAIVCVVFAPLLYFMAYFAIFMLIFNVSILYRIFGLILIGVVIFGILYNFIRNKSLETLGKFLSLSLINFFSIAFIVIILAFDEHESTGTIEGMVSAFIGMASAFICSITSLITLLVYFIKKLILENHHQ